MLEWSFNTAGIAQHKTKFGYAKSGLDTRRISGLDIEVRDLIMSTPTVNGYTTLKEELSQAERQNDYWRLNQ